MSYPKISIVVPSFNAEKYIGSTLESVVSQKYPNLEVIVQDGGSTDGTADIVKKYVNKYKDLFIVESKKDNGQVDAINKGFNKASGDILGYINADDCFKEDALLAVGETFSKFPKTLWVAGKGEVIDKDENVKWNLSTKYKAFLLSKNKYYLLLMVNYLMQPSVFISREAYKKYGPFIGTNKFVMQYDLWLKLGKVSMPIVIDKSLSCFRLSGENISSTSFRNTLKEDYKIVKKYTNDPLILGLHEVHNLGRVVTISKFNNN